MKEVVIIGFGGHAKVVAEIVKLRGDKVFGYLDDEKKNDHIIGRISDCSEFSEKHFIIAIGSNQVRKKISAAYPKLQWYTAIHPTAVISETASVGEGTVICANAVINADAIIGKHSIINTAAVVEHDIQIGDFCHISPNATLCGTVTIGDGTHIGAAAVVKNNISVGADVTVGIGAAVVKNLVEPGVYVGIPARKLD